MFSCLENICAPPVCVAQARLTAFLLIIIPRPRGWVSCLFLLGRQVEEQLPLPSTASALRDTDNLRGGVSRWRTNYHSCPSTVPDLGRPRLFAFHLFFQQLGKEGDEGLIAFTLRKIGC